MVKLAENSIMTVTGPIPQEELGFCHSHEHLFIAAGESARVNAALCIDSLPLTLAELELFKKAGGKSIIDAQPVGCGRIAVHLHQASTASGIQIVAATGFHKLIFYPADHWIHFSDESILAELFCSEFENGMFRDDNDVHFPTQRISPKPGIIKTATDISGISGDYRKLFEAAAFTAQKTGMPVLSHTEMGKAALEQIRFFFDRQLPATSIIICHLDRDLNDFSYHREVGQSGVYLEFDTIGRFKYHSDEAEADYILKMVEAGFADQILLGLDVTRERLKSYGGSPGLDYLLTCFIPLLKKYGLTDEVIAKFMIANPAKAFRISSIS